MISTCKILKINKRFFVSIASTGVNLRSNLLTQPFPSNSCTTRRNNDAFTGSPIPKKRKLSMSSTVGVATGHILKPSQVTFSLFLTLEGLFELTHVLQGPSTLPHALLNN